MPPRFQRSCPPEFRRQAVRLVEGTGRPYRESPASSTSVAVAADLVKQEQRDRGEREDGLTSEGREEPGRLRRQSASLRPSARF